MGADTSSSAPAVTGRQAGDSQERLLGIIASDAIITVDADQRITLFNAAAERMFRCPASQAIGTPLDRFIPERFRGAHRAHVEEFSRTGVTTRAMGHQRPLAALRADGEEFPVEATISQVTIGGQKLFTAIVRDITERRRAEEALRDREARLAAVVDTAVDAIITIDDRGAIDSVNPATERLFGYVRDELIGRNVSMLMPEPYHSEHDAYINRYLSTAQARVIGIGREVVGLRKDGTTFPIDLSVSEFRVAGRRMFTGIVHDISNRRRLEREILEASANEQRRVGHELHDGLCQQLTGIAFSAEILARRLASESPGSVPQVRKITGEIDQAITQARTLARGLNPVEIHADSLSSALEDLAQKVSGTFQVSCRFRKHGDTVVADNMVATHLYRIAQEAISNAIRHGKARKVEVSLRTSSAGLSLTVADDGTGFIPFTSQTGGRQTGDGDRPADNGIPGQNDEWHPRGAARCAARDGRHLFD